MASIGAPARNAMTKDLSSSPQARLRLVAVVVLALGLLAAVIVYVTAAQAEPDSAGYRIIGGQAYAGDDTRELQQLARLGGQAAVTTFKFQRWFSSLWQGQRLAYTLALISIVIALFCLHIASLMGEVENP
jgi:hypothetical protein